MLTIKKECLGEFKEFELEECQKNIIEKNRKLAISLIADQQTTRKNFSGKFVFENSTGLLYYQFKPDWYDVAYIESENFVQKLEAWKKHGSA